MMLYTIACMFNVLLDFVTTYITAGIVLESLGFRTYFGVKIRDLDSFTLRFESYGADCDAGGHGVMAERVPFPQACRKKLPLQSSGEPPTNLAIYPKLANSCPTAAPGPEIPQPKFGHLPRNLVCPADRILACYIVSRNRGRQERLSRRCPGVMTPLVMTVLRIHPAVGRGRGSGTRPLGDRQGPPGSRFSESPSNRAIRSLRPNPAKQWHDHAQVRVILDHVTRFDQQRRYVCQFGPNSDSI